MNEISSHLQKPLTVESETKIKAASSKEDANISVSTTNAPLGHWTGYTQLDDENHPSFYLERLSAHGSGQGTETVRHIVAHSISLGLKSRVHLQAVKSSHIFWLKMGFIPYVSQSGENAYEMEAEETIAAILQYLKSGEPELDDEDFKALQIILAKEKCLTSRKQAAALTKEDIMNNKQLLIEVLEEKNSCTIRYKLIPSLLSSLRKISSEHPCPDTSKWGPVRLYLSLEARKRWMEAISQDKPFVPFRKYELLRPFMSLYQIAEMERILSAK